LIPLHVGDTYLPPAVDVLSLEPEPTMHQYSVVGGEPALVEAACAHFSALQGTPVAREELLVTAGATGGLTALFAALLSPGDEALLLAPYWPLVAGGARLLGATPIAVPAFQESVSLDELIERLEEAYTPRAKLLYMNSPNNPTGEVLSRAWVEGLVAWAQRKGLWVVSDEVYDLFSFAKAHTYARALDPKRVIVASSMSKAFGMAGYRCGFLIGPPSVLAEVERAATYTMYSAPTPAQRAALAALTGPGRAWADSASKRYQEVGAEVARRLGVNAPEGGTFLFLNAAHLIGEERLAQRGLSALLEACADRGLLLAPGGAFGPYPHHLRLCFTSAPPERVLEGVERLLQVCASF
jgi:N-succinyldiaminopimelate aminotransferase